MFGALQDCRDMDALKSKSFDLVLDKATMDAIACGGNTAIAAYLKEVG